jgi:hypothetical protein
MALSLLPLGLLDSTAVILTSVEFGSARNQAMKGE